MILGTIIIIISLLLDGLLTNFFPYVGSLSFFTPLLTVVSISIIYPLFRKHEKRYLIVLFIIGIIYDLFYTNLLFVDGVLFLIIGLISIRLHKYIKIDYFKLIVFLLIILTTYEILNASIVFIFGLSSITILEVLIKILHTLLLNILYGEILYLIISLLPDKYKKISIN